MEPRRSKHFLAHIPTIALLVVFAMSAPLGVLFFILRAIDRDAEKKEQENADYSSDFRPQDTGAGQTARDTEPVYGHDVPTAEQQNAKKWHKTLTNLCTIMGAVAHLFQRRHDFSRCFAIFGKMSMLVGSR